MDQMESKEVVRENKTNMTSEQQVKAILQETRDLDQKKAAIYEQLMGELEPKGIRLINFNKLSAEEGKLLETYFDNEIAPYLSANIVKMCIRDSFVWSGMVKWNIAGPWQVFGQYSSIGHLSLIHI